MLHARGFSRIDVGNVNDGFFVQIQHFFYCIHISALVEIVAKAKGLQIGVAIELFIVGIGNVGKPSFHFRGKNGHLVAAKVGTCHGHKVGRGMVDKAIYHCPQPVAVFRRCVVKFVNGNQGAIKRTGTVHSFKGKAQGGMGA